jgi:hypothetical protein
MSTVECRYPAYRGAVALTDTFSEVSTSVFFLCLYLAAATVQVGILLQVFIIFLRVRVNQCTRFPLSVMTFRFPPNVTFAWYQQAGGGGPKAESRCISGKRLR